MNPNTSLHCNSVVPIKRNAGDFGIFGNDGTSGIDGLFGYSAQDVESLGRVEVVGSGNMAKALKEFETHLYDDIKPIGPSEDLTLTKDEINQFLKLAKTYEANDSFCHLLGLFSGKLVTNSYNADNNDFVFDLTNYNYKRILYGIKGKKDNPVKISITSNVPERFLNDCHYINIVIDGNVGYHSLSGSKHVSLKINGDVSSNFGDWARNLDVKINGNVGNYFGNASKHIFAKIKGDVGSHFGKFSKNLSSIIGGNTERNFASRSEKLSAIIKGDAQDFFGNDSHELLAFVEGKIESDYAYFVRNISSGKKVSKHKKYKNLKKEINARFKR
jgi:hypothetical protein